MNNVDSDDELASLQLNREILERISSEQNLRFRSSADELAVGSLILFGFLVFAAIAFGEYNAVLMPVSVISVFFFGGEWLEVRRLRKDAQPQIERFREKGFGVLCSKGDVRVYKLTPTGSESGG